MSSVKHTARLPLTSVLVPEDRQRSEVAVDHGLLSSIASHGVLSPILLRSESDPTLVYGERRLRASQQLGLPDIPVLYANELDYTALREIELVENLHRSELPWRDETRAIAELHELWCTTRAPWTQEKSARALGKQVDVYLRVARSLDDPKIASSPNVRHAYNICARVDARSADRLLEDISYATDEILAGVETEAIGLANDYAGPETVSDQQEGATTATETGGPSTLTRALAQGTTLQRSARPAPSESILHANFEDWAQTYTGPRFNFVHCDFPYGKNPFSGQWGGREDQEHQYADTDEIYWRLIEVLCEHRERLLTPTAHLMFWLSSEIARQHETIERFRVLAPDFIFQPRALVWYKSDNVGIVPDPKRGPRWVTELALMATRGDRPLVKPLANAYAAPTARALHPSTKPEPMLRHFFGMFVDETSRMLDPTCGAGSSLRAAESLGAHSVLGIERQEQYVSAGRKALREFRALREMTR